MSASLLIDELGPHIGLEYAWPMSLLLQAMTSEDDEEITKCLQMVLKASRLGLVHESINVNRIRDYTRSWFACTFLLPFYSLSDWHQKVS